MAIQDDFTIDYVDRKITYTTAFVDNRPPNIYTVNDLYSWLQDTFDEPAQMDEPIPMSAQTPTQYTLLYPWFMDNESMKALYSGSIQTSSWTKSAAEGITALRYASSTSEPDAADIGKAVTGDTSGATGVILAVDAARDIVWVRNTSATQFQGAEVVDDDATGTNPDFTTETTRGFQTGESIWSNVYSVGTRQANTEAYIGQEDDQLGGAAYHDSDADSQYERRIEKLDEWWDSDVDFTGGDLGVTSGHIDLLVLTKELGTEIDGQRLAVFARQYSKVYSHFEFVGGVGNFVVPFASTGADLNAQEGAYSVGFDSNSGTIVVGDVIENDTGTTPVGRLRAVITGGTTLGSATGVIEYYLIGDTEALATYDRTLIQFANDDNCAVRDGAVTFQIDTVGQAVTNEQPATVQGITITFGDAQYDIDENATDEEYACVIDCNSVPLADVYKRVMFLTSRGNQDGTVADTQDTLLPSAHATKSEAGEFYRAVGDVVIEWDARASTGISEGELVKGSLSGAYGVVTSASEDTDGIGVLTSVKGTFQDNDVVSDIDDGVTNTVTLDTAPVSIVDNTGAPFGTFAGGRWFVAQGVVLTNVPAADANNWETVDLGGNTIKPPTQRTITFAGLVANDRAAIFEVDTAGGIDITKDQNGVGAAGAAVSDPTIPLDSTIALDVPTTGWMRVVDTGTPGNEYRYEYSDITTTTVTLRTGAGLTGTCTSAGTSTVLNDTGAFANFGTDGNCKVGHEIYNVTDSSRAVVLRKIDDNSIETTPLTGGTGNDWGNTESWEANQVVVALVDADTCYFGFIDDVASGTSIAKTVKYVADTDLIARARFSDPDVGGTRILPFEQKNVTLTDANLTVTAIRTTDPIAS